jgi:starch synthase
VEELYQDGGFNWGGTFVRVGGGGGVGLNTIFLEPENGHFWRQCIYGRGDDHVRFSFFCGAAQEYVKVGWGGGVRGGRGEGGCRS